MAPRVPRLEAVPVTQVDRQAGRTGDGDRLVGVAGADVEGLVRANTRVQPDGQQTTARRRAGALKMKVMPGQSWDTVYCGVQG